MATAAWVPSTTYRVIKDAGLIGRASGKPSKKGSGFVQSLTPHEHWHVDFSDLNIGGVFRFLCAVLLERKNENPKPIHWQFASEKARVKLKPLYPSIRQLRTTRHEASTRHRSSHRGPRCWRVASRAEDLRSRP
jgi:hypothetical protein